LRPRLRPTHESSERQALSSRGIEALVDYTGLAVGVPIEGHLVSGEATDSTVRCPKCHRVGIAAGTLVDMRFVVHQGRVDGSTLDAIDYCQLSGSSQDNNAS
jgi:hypothetical protein